MNKQILQMLARMPARVWLQVILALVGLAMLAMLGFVVIAGAAGLIAITLLGFKARQWFEGLFSSNRSVASAPAPRQNGKVIDVQYEIVDRGKNDTRP